MSEHIDTELILAAWGMALTQRQPPAGLGFIPTVASNTPVTTIATHSTAPKPLPP